MRGRLEDLLEGLPPDTRAAVLAGAQVDDALVVTLVAHAVALPGGPVRRLGTLFALYEVQPHDAVQAGLYGLRQSLSAASSRALWRRYRRWLRADERWAAPAVRCLEGIWFQDPTTVRTAWRAVVRGAVFPEAVARLLAASGPVPAAIKAPYLRRLNSYRRYRKTLVEGPGGASLP